MNNPTIKHVNKQMRYISELADLLLDRFNTSEKTLVVPFVGAGASASASIPPSGELQQQLFSSFTKKNDDIAKILDEEAKFHYPQEAMLGSRKLSLFRFSSVLSSFAHGRKIIHDHISSAMRSATYRPLSYEHLAHLTKHEFVDHFVVLNYDELLDEALKDEVPDRLRFITSPDEVPGPKSIRDNSAEICFLFKPFGSLSTDYYKLKPDDITRYGSESIWRFMLDNIFRPNAGDTLPNIIIMLVGYAAAEPAFKQLLDELVNDPKRNIHIFVIDSRKDLPDSLSDFKSKYKEKIKHIKLQADLAIDLLLRVMKLKYLSADENKVWIPVARHRITSALRYIDITTPSIRFKIELILQAIKSRGFFTIEAISDIDRISKYSSSAYNVIKQMCEEGILAPYDSDIKNKKIKYSRQDYSLSMDSLRKLVAKLLETTQINQDEVIDEWEVQPNGDNFTAKKATIKYTDYFCQRFNEINTAPEIEVYADAHPATLWMFKNPKPLTSISKLTKATMDIFNSAFQEADEGKITLYALWTTGEWMFCDEGWAWKPIGNKIISHMNKKLLTLNLILSKTPPGKTLRQKRSEQVQHKLETPQKGGACNIFYLNWWKHNRVLTLLEWKNHGRTVHKGIYMRRRLATPLVAPIRVDGDDCSVLKDIYERYKEKYQRQT